MNNKLNLLLQSIAGFKLSKPFRTFVFAAVSLVFMGSANSAFAIWDWSATVMSNPTSGHSLPSLTTYTVRVSYPGTNFHVVCQTTGDWKYGWGGWSNVWDYGIDADAWGITASAEVPYRIVAKSYGRIGYYISDADLSTGYDSWIPGLPKCQ